MKTLFSLGFQSNNPFTVRHPSLVGAPSLGHPIPLRMGQDVVSSEFEHVADAEAQANAELRSKLLMMIAAGNKKLADVRAWISARINQDPTLEKSFGGDKVVAYNFLDWNDNYVPKNQVYADLAAKKAASTDPQNWDFSESLLAYVKEWADAIDSLSATIQQFGNTGIPQMPSLHNVAPVSTPIINPKTGMPVVTSSIAPGAVIRTPAPSSGISTNTLLVGGGIVAAAIAVILAMRG